MTGIHGVQPAGAPKPVDAAAPAAAPSEKVQPGSISDVVEISEVAKLAAKVREIPPVRTELVERIKAEIAAGTYETPERMEITVERLMEELFP